MVKSLPAIQETQVQSWVGKITWKRKWQSMDVGAWQVQFMGSPRVRLNWVTSLSLSLFHGTFVGWLRICGFQDLICRVSTEYLPPRVIAREELRHSNVFAMLLWIRETCSKMFNVPAQEMSMKENCKSYPWDIQHIYFLNFFIGIISEMPQDCK